GRGPDEHLEMQVRSIAESAATGPPKELARGNGWQLCDADSSIGGARQVVVDRMPPVGMLEPDEVPERSELRRPVPTLDVDDGAVLCRCPGTSHGHRVVDAGVLVVDPSPMRLSVIPDLPGPIEL